MLIELYPPHIKKQEEAQCLRKNSGFRRTAQMCSLQGIFTDKFRHHLES